MTTATTYKPALNLKTLIAVQTALGACLSYAVYLAWGFQPGASFGLGALLMMVNLILLAWIWDRLLAKKSIAWTVMIIVIKYTVLLYAILLFVKAPWFHVLSCGLGLGTFVMMSLAQAAFMFRE